MKIFIDPGHGGNDPGAINTQLGLTEASLNLDIALRLNTILTQQGYKTMMSRKTNTYLTLIERAEMANNWNADYFISIHINSNVNEKANGLSTYFYKTGGLAELLAKSVENKLVIGTGWKDLGIIPRDLAVLRRTKMPAILTENGFISNTIEAKELSTAITKQKIADATASGLNQFLKSV